MQHAGSQVWLRCHVGGNPPTAVLLTVASTSGFKENPPRAFQRISQRRRVELNANTTGNEVEQPRVTELQEAIRAEFEHLTEPEPIEDNRGQSLAGLRARRTKLLDLYYGDQITAETFQEEELRLTTQINELEAAEAERDQEHAQRVEIAQRFEEVAEFLANLDLTEIWEEATDKEKRILIEDLLEAIYIYPDHLRVVANGAPPIKVDPAEVGLRPAPGMGLLVSEGGLELRVWP